MSNALKALESKNNPQEEVFPRKAKWDWTESNEESQDEDSEDDVEMWGRGYKKQEIECDGDIDPNNDSEDNDGDEDNDVNLMTVMMNPKVEMSNLMNLERTMIMTMMMTGMILNI